MQFEFSKKIPSAIWIALRCRFPETMQNSELTNSPVLQVHLVSPLSSFHYSTVTLKWVAEVFRNMLDTCFQTLPIRTSIFFCHPDLLYFKKNLQYTSTVFIYLKCTIPSVPSRCLSFQVLLVFILVACYFLISGPACSCCSSPCRWNTPASLSHSQEYSWNDDWQSRRTTHKETEILKLKSRRNQDRVSFHFPKMLLWPLRDILLVKHAPIRTVSPHLPLSPFTAGMCIWT